MDATKVNFYSSAPKWKSEMDEILYPSELYKEYFLEIHVSALANTENICFELVASEGKSLVIKKTFSKSELFDNYKQQSKILISLGNLEIIDYELFIRQEKMNKKADYVVSKKIAQ